MFHFIMILFLSIPAVAAVLLVVSLILSFSAKADNKKNPGTYTEKQLRRYKLTATVSGVITAAFGIIILGMVGLLYLAVAFM